jgi:hypothetical protein
MHDLKSFNSAVLNSGSFTIPTAAPSSRGLETRIAKGLRTNVRAVELVDADRLKIDSWIIQGWPLRLRAFAMAIGAWV